MEIRENKISGYLILIGVSQFFLCMLIAEAIYPNYSIKSNYISDLGIGKTAIIFNTSIILMGVLIIIASITLRKLISILFFMTGLGSMLVGIFPETTGLIHLIAALIAFLFGGIGAVVTSITNKIYFWTILGFITLLCLILYLLKYYGQLGAGGMERLIVYPELIWGISFATYLIK
ncbi:MAG: DUF998 domain-containing protein [Saccharolobus sp.]|jgi:hypothetical membrane protein|uniref:DUF998 domain-containing protein n=1 Tax=Saccharolobus sp. TaxID=2100761 RepID=UPI0028CE2FFC|nr:DUF998 domain-containing protein [Saccharolobus sp.]MDT7861755.1 DUF998 domain-containing protein [Saccharolobus sp.]